MAIIPNRIVLISRGRHDEAKANADCYPGMLLQMNSDGSVQAQGAAGGVSNVMIVKEDALQGKDITQKLPSGNTIPFQRPAKGDLMLLLLQNGQNVTAQTSLFSAGDGTVIADPGSKLYEILASSASISGTAVETTFSNGSYTIPANFLAVGDVLTIRGKATVTGQNSTDTQNVKVYLGSTVIAASGAQGLAANQVVEFNLAVTIRAITSTGKFVVDGILTFGAASGGTVTQITVASTTIDTTVAEVIKVTATSSAGNAADAIQLDEFEIDLSRATGASPVAIAQEAINNSGGTGTSGFNTAAFIRCQIP